MMRKELAALSALAVVASADVAAAADLPVKAPASEPEKVEYGNLYFGVDWTSHRSLVGYMGVLYAPNGMEQSGLRLAAFGLTGQYRYHGDDAELFRGKFVSADGLIGWSNVFDNGALTLSIGANYQDHRVRPLDPSNTVAGARTGFKVEGDLWLNPTPVTLVYLLGSYSTAFDTYYAIGRLGYDFAGSGVFLGPEVGGQGNDRTDQVRVGAHVSGVTLGTAKLGVSGGFMRERGDGCGWYATANLDFSF
jgi:opacity protein-like surface antigen